MLIQVQTNGSVEQNKNFKNRHQNSMPDAHRFKCEREKKRNFKNITQKNMSKTLEYVKTF